MSKKVLKLAGKRPILLALIILATFALGIIFSGWLTPTPSKAQQYAADSTPSQETTNCEVASTTTTCSEGSVSFALYGASDCGLPITVLVTLTNTAGQIVTDTSYTNTGNSGSSACPDTYTTNNPDPAIISQTWADSSSTNHGTDLSATFRPSAQSGSVTFTVVWQHVCDTNTETITTSIPYNVPCPTITNCIVDEDSCAPSGSGAYGATIGYNFNCADGYYSWESCSVADSCTTNNSGLILTNATLGVDWNAGDQMYTADPSGGSCSVVSSQTIYFALVGGGGTTNNNSVCSFNNTQTITITQTNYPNNHPHGTIVTSVTIGGGASKTCTY